MHYELCILNYLGILFNLQWNAQAGNQLRCCIRPVYSGLGRRPNRRARYCSNQNRVCCDLNPKRASWARAHSRFLLNLHPCHSTTPLRYRSCRIFQDGCVPSFQFRVFRIRGCQVMVYCYLLRHHFQCCTSTNPHYPFLNSRYCCRLFR